MNSPALGRIPFPHGFWAGIRRLGLGAADIVRKAGLPPDLIDEPAVTAAQYIAIWQAYSDLIGDTAEGIVKLATAFETAKYPPAVMAVYHARDYRDALGRMARYKQMCPPESLLVREEGDACVVELAWTHAGPSGPPLLVGITLAFLLELGRRGTGLPLTAARVEFSQAMGDSKTLEAYFGCEVRIGTAYNRLTLRREDLDRPFISDNEELVAILAPVLDRSLDARQRGLSTSETVVALIKRRLAGGRIDIQAIAKELGMSERTLQRRLAEEQSSFKQLLMQARHEQARAYLADTTLDIKEVAFLIGYEDQNSFYRAFRLWEGDTPAQWRMANMARAAR
ncbi:helix-turn-helix transcriptional regulator [Cohnella sp. JJ-181]|uniref:helix-turn-helix transcriptional regulator n=1 Tax=Cohnella rhizoplanae TaxID=2974897 RepID=UPI0022FFA4A9|nr:AraC family transcriptional regulator [Cohnella sp. JJ-181]CAI6033984.1 hypothetical protein COHCIP112018_00819 [Cohnella sp. JJ-181]